MNAYQFSPSERTATTVAEFLEACQAEPLLAAQHLREGYFEPWLVDAGRRDLAETAAQIRLSGVASVDGLQQFVQVALETQRQVRAGKAPRLPSTKSAPSRARSRKGPER